MIQAFKRKFNQLAADPVLRRWLAGRVLGRNPSPPAFTPHVPPYAAAHLPLAGEQPTIELSAAPEPGATPVPGHLPLAGLAYSFDPSNAGTLFDDGFDDIETYLSAHRFAWLPLLGAPAAAALAHAWPAWAGRFATPDGSWAWHPYTAAERVINLLDHFEMYGCPGDPQETADILARHAPAIAARLEYFGNHDTSNHLANNGRGLYRLGCALGLPGAEGLGREILRHEAERIFLTSGMLREGSFHYHLLYLRNYLDVWRVANQRGRDADAEMFRSIAERAAGAAKALGMPGRTPLIGDISPDCPPAFLSAILDGAGGWLDVLSEEQQGLVRQLVSDARRPEAGELDRDGWLRGDHGDWSTIAYAPPGGWPPMPGHAHQDMGSAEIHFRGVPVFVDPGRGRYGEQGEASFYRSSAAHGTLRLDGQDPYPPNKPYYDEAFRARVALPTARSRTEKGFEVSHGGYERLGGNSVVRRWTFGEDSFVIDDMVSGHGTHGVERILVTPLAVEITDDCARIAGPSFQLEVSAEGIRPTTSPITIWSAYGTGSEGMRISFSSHAPLPWQGKISVRVFH